MEEFFKEMKDVADKSRVNKRRANINVRDTGRDSGEDYEEEKIPGGPSSSGIQPHHFDKREKNKQSQPYGRQSEGPSSQYSGLIKQDPRPSVESYTHNLGGSHLSQTNQRQRILDQRQGHSTGDSNHNKNNRRKDLKLSAESGGTDFNQNPSTPNQTEELKSNSTTQHYQYESSIQGNATPPSASNRANIGHLNIGQRSTSPEGDRNFPGITMNRGGNIEEDVVLEENELLTPRRQEQLENESKKTSGASTPSRDGANTPTRKNFNDVQDILL